MFSSEEKKNAELDASQIFAKFMNVGIFIGVIFHVTYIIIQKKI